MIYFNLDDFVYGRECLGDRDLLLYTRIKQELLSSVEKRLDELDDKCAMIIIDNFHCLLADNDSLKISFEIINRILNIISRNK